MQFQKITRMQSDALDINMQKNSFFLICIILSSNTYSHDRYLMLLIPSTMSPVKFILLSLCANISPENYTIPAVPMILKNEATNITIMPFQNTSFSYDLTIIKHTVIIIKLWASSVIPQKKATTRSASTVNILIRLGASSILYSSVFLLLSLLFWLSSLFLLLFFLFELLPLFTSCLLLFLQLVIK